MGGIQSFSFNTTQEEAEAAVAAAEEAVEAVADAPPVPGTVTQPPPPAAPREASPAAWGILLGLKHSPQYPHLIYEQKFRRRNIQVHNTDKVSFSWLILHITKSLSFA